MPCYEVLGHLKGERSNGNAAWLASSWERRPSRGPKTTQVLSPAKARPPASPHRATCSRSLFCQGFAGATQTPRRTCLDLRHSPCKLPGPVDLQVLHHGEHRRHIQSTPPKEPHRPTVPSKLTNSLPELRRSQQTKAGSRPRSKYDASRLSPPSPSQLSQTVLTPLPQPRSTNTPSSPPPPPTTPATLPNPPPTQRRPPKAMAMNPTTAPPYPPPRPLTPLTPATTKKGASSAGESPAKRPTSSTSSTTTPPARPPPPTTRSTWPG